MDNLLLGGGLAGMLVLLALAVRGLFARRA